MAAYAVVAEAEGRHDAPLDSSDARASRQIRPRTFSPDTNSSFSPAAAPAKVAAARLAWPLACAQLA
jgi:hypothetical protein